MEWREEAGRLVLQHRLMPQAAGRIFGVGWVAIWSGALVALAAQMRLLHVHGREIPVNAWLFAVAMPPVWLLAVARLTGLWRGWREVEFSEAGIVVREKRWRLRESRYPAERVARLRGTFAGWRETVLFDCDGRSVGLELPLTDEERARLLAHPAVRRFVR